MRTFAAVSIALTLAPAALAQDGAGRQAARDLEADVVREVERGAYAKANVGSTFMLNTHGQTRGPEGTGPGLFAGVLGVGLGVGTDFVDRERFSAAFEFQFNQGLFNGPRDIEVRNQTLSQGDIHTLSAIATLEASTYITRRLGIGVRGGGGAMFFPLLVEPNAYRERLQEEIGSNTASGGGNPAELHDAGMFIVLVAGPTIEYYTKLSHFSIGADVDLQVITGFDIGIYPSGYLKYTF